MVTTTDPRDLDARRDHSQLLDDDERTDDLRRRDAPSLRRPGRRSRARRLAMVVAALAVMSIAGAGFAVLSTAPDDPLAGAPIIEAPGSDVAVSMVGDTLLGDAAQPFIARFGGSWVGDRLEPFPDGDVVIANLEGPITDRTEPADPTQRWSYNADPEMAQILAQLGVDAVSLANNHAMDRGAEGLDDTLTGTGSAAVAAIGAGPTSSEARLPLLITSDSLTVAVAAFGDSSGDVTAANDRPGLRRASRSNFVADHDLARQAGANQVVAFVHWGENYAAVDDRQRTLARSLVDAGYDLVVGHGSHTTQPMEYIDGVPVFYSLGNWIFGTPGRFTEDAPGYGLVLRTVFSPVESDGADMAFELRCVFNDNEVVNFQPRPCNQAQAERVLGSVHPDVAVDGTVGRLGGS